MGTDIGGVIASIGLFGLIGGLIVLSWPFRREGRFTFRRVIAAPPERIWGVYRIDLDDPGNAAFHSGVVSAERPADDPRMQDLVIDASGGHGTHLVKVRSEVLVEEKPARYVTRLCELDGKPFPFGADNSETFELQDRPEGTLVTLTWRGETASLWQLFAVWRMLRSFLPRLARFCESGVVPPRKSARAVWTSLAISVLAVASFALWIGWVGAILLAVIAVVHEFGHWLAMRLTGQPAPRMMLVPFFGGIAVANHPHKTLFDDAFCSLMGAGFSALLCLGLLVVTAVAGLPELGDDWPRRFAAFLIGLPGSEHGIADFAEVYTRAQMVALAAVLLASWIGALNLFQLLPVLPLDGGHILRAVVQSFSAPWAPRILLLLAGAGMAALAFGGYYLFAAILGLGALQAWYIEDHLQAARPMGALGIIVIGLGVCLTLAIHTTAALFGLWLLAFV